MKIMSGRHLVTPSGVIDGWLRLDGGLIVEMGHGQPPHVDLDAGSGWIVPGFIDLHCHGGDGVSLYSGSPEDVIMAARGHLEAGTTAMFASVATMPPEAMIGAVRTIAEVVASAAAPNIVGIHLEGPFLSPRRRGAQTESGLRMPDAALMDAFLQQIGELPLIMTIAPELPGAAALIAQYRERVVFALGHSDASYAESITAIDSGARMVTHTFNAMPPLGHREPGLVGAALSDSRVAIELIADGHHLHDAVLELAVSAAGVERVVLVTDASAAAGMSDGDLSFADRDVTVANGQVTLRGSDTLAGSALRLATAHARMRTLGHVPADAAAMSSTNAADVVGMRDRGRLEVGCRADIVVLDENSRVSTVLHGGRQENVR